MLSVGFDPRSVAAGDPGSGVFFVSNCAAGWYSTVWEFSAATDQPLQQIGAPWVCPDGLAVHGGTVYAANSTLAILSVAGDAVTGGFSGVPAEGIAVDSATGVVYTTDGGGTGQVWAVPPQAPAFTSAGSTSVAAGSADTFWVQTSANPAPTYSETGQLPAGVHLASWGEIYLSPEAGTGGRYPVTISASDGVGTPSTQSFVLTVTQAAGFASAAKATFRTGRAGSFAIKVTGYPAPVLTETGSLPAGLKLAGHTISGTPAAGSGGTYRLTLTAANSSGPAATQAFVLTVNAAPTFTSPRTVTCHPGRSCSFTVRSAGFPAATISESGTLPRGLTFRAGQRGTGVLSGTARRADSGKTFRIAFRAANGVGQPVVQHFTLRIG